MFTSQESPLLTGSPEEIETFIEADTCLVVDWRGSEEEMLEDLTAFLPEGVLEFEIDFPEDDQAGIQLRFAGREDRMVLPFQPGNQFRVLLRLAELMRPEYEIGLFRSGMDSDTQAFWVRPREWWQRYREEYPGREEQIFAPIGELRRLWKLDSSAGKGPEEKKKPWWKVW